MPDSVFRPGDRAKITKPHVFVRCGYPKCKADYYDLIASKGAEVRTLLNALGADVGLPFSAVTSIESLGMLDTSGDLNDWEFKLRDALAYILLKHDRYGGRTRSIHTREDPALADRIVSVQSKRCVITGEYVPDSVGWEAGDYEPAELANRQTHVILTVAADMFPFEIEAANLQKLDTE